MQVEFVQQDLLLPPQGALQASQAGGTPALGIGTPEGCLLRACWGGASLGLAKHHALSGLHSRQALPPQPLGPALRHPDLQGRQFDVILDSAVYHVFARGSADKENYVRTLGLLLKPGGSLGCCQSVWDCSLSQKNWKVSSIQV